MRVATVSSLFAAVEDIAAYDGRGLPPGIGGRIDRVVSALRGERAPLAHAAEAIALDIHRLGNALLQHDAAADLRVAAIKSDLARTCWQRLGEVQMGSATA